MPFLMIRGYRVLEAGVVLREVAGLFILKESAADK
jgi:hypothetical protein